MQQRDMLASSSKSREATIKSSDTHKVFDSNNFAVG